MSTTHTLKGTGHTDAGWVAICECGEASWGGTCREAWDAHDRHVLAAVGRRAVAGWSGAVVVSLAMWAGIVRAVAAVIR